MPPGPGGRLEETQKLISGECRKENIAKSYMKNRFFSNFYLECSVQLDLELEIRVPYIFAIDVEAGQKLKFNGLEYSNKLLKLMC